MVGNQPRILYYDCETSPLKAWVWGLGEQYVRHGQLDKNHNMWGIICVTYCWNDGSPAKCIGWGYEEQDTAKVVREFDEIIKQADQTIGKNSDRFDTKMINSCRMFSGLPGMPDWTLYTDDLEKQMRKHFRLPSQSLDYISAQLGLGGKIKMEMQDWIDIVERNANGLKSYKKMCKYGMKDVEDTRTLWNKLSEHFTPKFKRSIWQAQQQGNTSSTKEIRCNYAECGSTNLSKNGIAYAGQTAYQRYLCKDCHRHAGRWPMAAVEKAEKAKKE
jgi:hypothetical protein